MGRLSIKRFREVAPSRTEADQDAEFIGARCPHSFACPPVLFLAPGGRPGPLPAEGRSERPGEPGLGVGDDQDPGPEVRRFGGAEFRGGPAEGLLREAEVCSRSSSWQLRPHDPKSWRVPTPRGAGVSAELGELAEQDYFR
jgi:hypothetical protein